MINRGLIEDLSIDEFINVKIVDMLVDGNKNNYISGEDSYFHIDSNYLVKKLQEKGGTKEDINTLKKLIKSAQARLDEMKKDKRQKEREKKLPCLYGTDIIEQKESQLSLPEDISIPNLNMGIYHITVDGIQVAGTGVICRTPIVPVCRYISRESGEIKYELLWMTKTKKGRRFQKKIISQEQLATKNSIVKLAKNGIGINAENASEMISYFDYLIFANADVFEERTCTEKLGWTDDTFQSWSPLDDGAVFDGDDSVRQYFNAIQSVTGNREEYFERMRQIRAQRRVELNMMISATMAAPLVRPLSINSFIVNLFGGTGVGKTLAMMTGLSQIGDPALGTGLIASFDSSVFGIQRILDVLESYPLGIDDSATLSSQREQNLEKFVYDLCKQGGDLKGTSDGGLRRTFSHHTAIITTGETSLVSKVKKGGAYNRVIDIPVETSEKFFKDGPETAAFFKSNHGHVIKDYIAVLKEMGIDELLCIFNNYVNKLRVIGGSTEKQIMPLALILTADKILADKIYQDNIYLNISDVSKCAKKADEVSDGARAYSFLLEKINANQQKMKLNQPDTAAVEQWGYMIDKKDEGMYAYLQHTQLRTLLDRDGYSLDSLKSWAIEKGLMKTDKNGNPNITTTYEVQGRKKSIRMYQIKVLEDDTAEKTKASYGDINQPIPVNDCKGGWINIPFYDPKTDLTTMDIPTAIMPEVNKLIDQYVKGKSA